jgi:hypothetical protein
MITMYKYNKNKDIRGLPILILSEIWPPPHRGKGGQTHLSVGGQGAEFKGKQSNCTFQYPVNKY